MARASSRPIGPLATPGSASISRRQASRKARFSDSGAAPSAMSSMTRQKAYTAWIERRRSADCAAIPSLNEEPEPETMRFTTPTSLAPSRRASASGTPAKAAAASRFPIRTRVAIGSSARRLAAWRRAMAIVAALWAASRRERTRCGRSAARARRSSTRSRAASSTARRGAHVRRIEKGPLPARLVHPGHRQVDAVEGGAILHEVLEVVEDLQRRAQRVRRGVRARRLAVEAQQEAAHRVGRAAAIVDELRPVGVARFHRVLPEGVDQRAGLLDAPRRSGRPPRGAPPRGARKESPARRARSMAARRARFSSAERSALSATSSAARTKR